MKFLVRVKFFYACEISHASEISHACEISHASEIYYACEILRVGEISQACEIYSVSEISMERPSLWNARAAKIHENTVCWKKKISRKKVFFQKKKK